MTRRFALIFVATAMLLVPALSFALPRPTGASIASSEQQICFANGQCDVTVSSATTSATFTPQLLKGRDYRVEVIGTWLYEGTANPNKKADAVCETSNGTNWAPSSSRGIEIQNIFYGGSKTCLPNSANPRKYSFPIKGSGAPQGEPLRIIDTNYAEPNSGALIVRVWAYLQVTYEMPLVNQELPGAVVEYPIPERTVTPGTIPPITVPSQTIPGVAIPLIGNIVLGHNAEQQWCLTITTAPQSLPGQGPIPGQNLPLGCVFDPGTMVGQPLPDANIPIGGNSIPGQGLCQTGCEILPGVPLDPMVIPGTTVSAGIPAGSTLELTLQWSADTTKLWRTPVNDENPSTGAYTTALYAPFHTTTAGWFVDEVQAGRQGLTLSGRIKDWNQQTVGNIGPVTIAGMGQLLEAIFWTQVAGM